MTTEGIILLTTESVLLVLMIIINRIDKILIKAYKDRIDKIEGAYDEVLDYCLTRVLKDSIDKEDYETATRCQQLLKKLKP